MQSRTLSTFSRWGGFTATRRQQRAILQRVALKRARMALLWCSGQWWYWATHKTSLRRGLAKGQELRLAKLLGAWREAAGTEKRHRVAVVRMLQRQLQTSLAAAFEDWVVWAAGHKVWLPSF
jgi:hypothetical protein